MQYIISVHISQPITVLLSFSPIELSGIIKQLVRKQKQVSSSLFTFPYFSNKQYYITITGAQRSKAANVPSYFCF